MILLFRRMDPLANWLAFYGFTLQAALKQKKKETLQSSAASKISLEVTVFARPWFTFVDFVNVKKNYKKLGGPLQLNMATLFYSQSLCAVSSESLA